MKIGSGQVDERIRGKIETLRKEIGMGLRNHLVFPKTIMGLLRDGKATKDQILRMQDDIDKSIQWVDVKFADFLNSYFC